MVRRRRRVKRTLLLCVLLAMPEFLNAQGFTESCRPSGTSLIVEHETRAALVDIAMPSAMVIPPEPGILRLAGKVQQALDGLGPARWRVVRTADDRAQTIEVRDTGDGSLIFERSFTHRIELAASAVSPSSRFMIHLQANNVASEVTILDAYTGVTRVVAISHNADLAAYAIGIVFSPDDQCAAISMERAGAAGAETWLLDLRSGAVAQLSIPDIFAIVWI